MIDLINNFFDHWVGVRGGDNHYPSVYMLSTGIACYAIVWIGYLVSIFRGHEIDIGETMGVTVGGAIISVLIAMIFPLLFSAAIIIGPLWGLTWVAKRWGENYRRLEKGPDMEKLDKTVKEMEEVLDKGPIISKDYMILKKGDPLYEELMSLNETKLSH